MSAVMPEQSNSNVAELFAPGPGDRLRAARLSMGLELTKVATELHLTSKTVEALEADSYQGIGARVFVRGYLRNYARIVGMPVDSILRQFDEKWPDDSAHRTMVRVTSPTLPADRGPGRGIISIVTWLLVLGLIALFLMWWRGYLDAIVPEPIRTGDAIEQTQAAPSTDGAADDTLPPLTGGGLLSDADSASADGSLRLPAPPADEDFDQTAATAPTSTANPAVVATAPVANNAQSTAAFGTSSFTMAPGAPVQISDGSSSDGSARETGISATQDGGAPVIDGSQQIVMTFTGPCWVDVRDSDREFKLFGNMPKGTRKVLGGRPPYNVVIGNSQAVEISVNGQPFDLARYAKGNVARFTLDP